MSDKEYAKKRTRRMLDEARRKFKAHEEASRASGGMNSVPLSQKLKVALPLAAIAVALYTFSYHYGRKRFNMGQISDQPKILTDVRDIDAPDVETDFSKLFDDPPLFEDMPHDDNKKW